MILTTILSATTLTGFGLAWWTYCMMRNAESLADKFDHELARSFIQLRFAKEELHRIQSQRREAGRKGGLATAQRKRLETGADTYIAALDAERFAQTLDRLDRDFPA